MKSIWLLSCVAVFLMTAASNSFSAGHEDVVEVGTVQWNRDLAAAEKESKRTGKPIFLFFQEVPG